MGVKRSLQCGGTLLGLLANISTVLSTATNYWIRFPTGHSGLWQDCTQGACSNMPCQSTLAVTGACMVLGAAFSLVGLVMALRILYQEGNPRGRTTSAVFFLCAPPPPRPRLSGGWAGPGLLLLIALTGYTLKNAWKNDVFFSWSYFSGWLAVPFYILAGFCFLLADMILQSTEAIGGFPVCL
ncbi:hypothetical protein QTO34_010053 [Cnephaeus nilssonii]|uniref:Claudin domain-containing protein 2 n=1 Tax=Cnephaeus nilssonii TaxID=3371016 RepID=A0AA40HFM7_CNENI|nr:hypothetical protein QTO34_010053 [Eptesicus nilssonii]